MIEVTLVLARGEKVFKLPEDFSGCDAAMMAAGIKLAGVQEFREHQVRERSSKLCLYSMPARSINLWISLGHS